MKTVTIIKQVFSYSELSEAAKENARNWYREGGLEFVSGELVILD